MKICTALFLKIFKITEEIIMKKFSVNGQEFESVELDFNFFCDIEDKFGISKEKFLMDEMRAIRVYLAMCADITLKEAGKLIEEHIMGGNDLTEIGNALSEEIENSGFIKWLMEQGEKQKEAPKPTTKSNAKK